MDRTGKRRVSLTAQLHVTVELEGDQVEGFLRQTASEVFRVTEEFDSYPSYICWVTDSEPLGLERNNGAFWRDTELDRLGYDLMNLPESLQPREG